MFDLNVSRSNLLSIHPGNIHPTAFISPGASVHPQVSIGPFVFVGENVSIDEGTSIGAHAIIEGWTTIGQRNQIFAGAIIGNVPQDLKYQGENSHLIIGDDNIIREYATISRGTLGGGGRTVIGDHNLMMSYVHIAHDVQMGHHNVVAHAAGVGGHVTIGDWVTIGGLSAIHQFIKIGSLSMIGAHSKITRDVIPYALVDGNPAKLNGVNVVRLRRNSVSLAERGVIHAAFKILAQSDLSLTELIDTMERELPASAHVETIQRFLREAGRGIYR